MNLLVTGGAGFIGCNLLRFLINRAEIHRVVNVDCLTYAGHLANLVDIQSHPKYLFERENICNRARVVEIIKAYGITHVIHLAAESHVDRSITDPDTFVQTNIVGTFQLLEACLNAWKSNFNNKRFLHVSTDEVYGSLGVTGCFTEFTPYAPNSPYAASKASADMLVRSFQKTYGLPTVVTNCSNNYGPFQFPEKLIPVAIQSALSQRKIPIYGDGLNRRDWIYVTDHCNALFSVLLRGRNGETYNIGGGNEWANLQIVELICDAVDELAPSCAFESRRLITFIEDRLGHDRRYAVDSTKIRAELNWEPCRAIMAGIRETVQWYIANQNWVLEVQQKHTHASSV